MGLFVTCFIPQIIFLLKTKIIAGISISLWVMVVVGYLTGLIYVISLKDMILIGTYSVGLILSGITLWLILFYKLRSIEKQAKPNTYL